MTLQNLTGQTLGQYELRELIGTGGMGAVYRGTQTSLQRAVAVKVLSTALASEAGYLERFYREAKTAASLEHAHIVPVYDYGIQREISYVVMRLLTGGTLADRMQRRAETGQALPSPGEISGLLSQIASALDYAHSQGVIHRDIKPSNIMFDNQGNAYLVDFGIAKLLSATSALTGTGTMMGTPSFMPPEQWRSEELTPAADQYALGVTIYALLVGRSPYEATTPFGLMHKHINEAPTPAHTQRPDLPPEITLVLERALAKKPEDRFPSVTAFAQAFDRVISGHTGEMTGFFMKSLPRKTPQAMTMPTMPEEEGMEGKTTPLPGAATPPSASIPKVTPPAGTPPAGGPPSLAMQPPGKPTHRSPLVWGLAAALVIALIVILVLALGGNKASKKTTATPGTALGGIATATQPSPSTPGIAATETPAVSPSATPHGGIVVLPSRTPAPTQTPAASLTPTPPPTATPTPPPTLTPTIPPTQTPRPTDTPSPVPTLPPTFTPQPTDTPAITGTPESAAVDIAPGLELVVGDRAVPVRTRPNVSAQVITTIMNQRLPITGMTADKTWFRVQVAGQEGWVREIPAVRIESAAPPTTGPVLVVALSGVSVRTRPTLSAALITTITNTRLPITGRTADNTWVQVEARGQTGWVQLSDSATFEGDLTTAPVIGETTAAGPVTYRTLLDAGITTFDPQRITLDDHGSIQMAEQLFMGLTSIDPTHPGLFMPRIAKSWKVSDDGKTWTFSLRGDVLWVRWNPDTKQPEILRAVNAADFVTGIKRACDPRLGNWYNWIVTGLIDGCDKLGQLPPDKVRASDYDLVNVGAPDDVTLVVHLQYPASHFFSLTSLWLLRPVPREMIDKFGDQWSTPANLFTNGAFLLASADGTHFDLLRNPTLPADLRGPGNVDHVALVHEEDPTTAFDMFQKQQIDAEPVTGSTLADRASKPDVAKLLHVVSEPTTYFLGFTYDKPPFDNQSLRRAFSFAVNRNVLIRTVLPYQALAMIHLTPPGIFGAPPLDQVGVDYNVVRAKTELQNAGFPNCQGLPPLTFAIRTGQKVWADVLIKSFEQDLGCSASLFTVHEYSQDDLTHLLENGSTADRPNLWMMIWSADYPDASDWASPILGCGNPNYMRRPCQDVDSVMDRAFAEPNPDMQIKMYLDIERALFGPMGEYPLIPLLMPVHGVLAQSWVTGPFETDGIFGGTHYDWITVDPQAQQGVK